MPIKDYTRLKAQIAILREIAMEYKGCTIENIISQMESRIKYFETNQTVTFKS